MWVKKPVVPTFDATAKIRMISRVQELVAGKEKLKRIVNRIDMRGNRIYLYLARLDAINGIKETVRLV
jgi:hypothetical protein